ncbi:MAG: DUF6263 family protein [Planctomycetota bacterium]
MALVVLCLVPQTASAQPTKLTWGWALGTTQRFQLTESMTQSLSGPAASDLEWQRTVIFTQTVAQSNAGLVIRRTFGPVAVEVEGYGDAPVRYDPQDPATAQNARHPLIAPFVAMSGQTLRVQLDADGRVTGVDGTDELFRAMAGPLAQADPSLSRHTGLPVAEQALIEQTQAALDLIPGRRVRTGESWDVAIPHTIPLVGKLNSDVAATLMSSRNGIATITIEGALTQAEDEARPTLLQLTGSQITGKIEFDTRSGQPETQSLTIESNWTAANDLLEALQVEETTQTIRQTAELKRLPSP